MAMFDASNRDQCEVKRLKTNTPLQALVMMNDPSVLEASRVLSQKLMLDQSAVTDKITKAFRLIVCRKPSAKELSITGELLQRTVAIISTEKIRCSYHIESR